MQTTKNLWFRSITINEKVTGEYGNYDFDVEGCTIVDTGIVIDEDTIAAEPRVRLTGNVFHFSTYTLNLEIIHYTDTKIIDDDDTKSMFQAKNTQCQIMLDLTNVLDNLISKSLNELQNKEKEEKEGKNKV